MGAESGNGRTAESMDLNAEITKAVRRLEGTAYVAVGLGVLGFQRAQVYRLALRRELGALGGVAQKAAGGAVRQLAQDIRSRTAPARQNAVDVGGEALQHLPDAARELLGAMANVVVELPGEAKALAGEVVALSRFVVHAAGAPASRYASRQGA
jgi:hypothetical protein